MGWLRAKLLKRAVSHEVVLLFSVVLLVLSIVLAILSLYPASNGDKENHVLLNETFHLTSREIRRQGLGSFQGGENITVLVQGNQNYPKNFSIITYRATNFTYLTNENVSLSFLAGADYYESVFYSLPETSGNINLTVILSKDAADYPFIWLMNSAKILFTLSISVLMIVALKFALAQNKSKAMEKALSLDKTGKKRLLILVLISLLIWLSLLAVNSNSLGGFEDWYTDHARHPYTATLFLTKGFSVFDVSLDQLASSDTSYYKFVTWPEMTHLYPLGSVFLFMPFGVMLQSGIDALLVMKLEIALFLVFAHLSLYFFLKKYWVKPIELPWKLVGVYIIYVLLVIFAANGMFDAVPFLFSFFAITMFLTKRYDYFILFVAVSIFLKYQAGIFLLPLIIYSLIELYRTNGLLSMAKNKAVLIGAALAVLSAFTAVLSLPYLLNTRPELIMNGINAFNSHSQISWPLQATAVILTLVATLIYAIYMFKKNSLLAFSSIFLLIPSFMMPYVQNWYLPFLFIYILIPIEKKHVGATLIWLVFMIFMLSFGGASFNPLLIIENFKTMLKL